MSVETEPETGSIFILRDRLPLAEAPRTFGVAGEPLNLSRTGRRPGILVGDGSPQIAPLIAIMLDGLADKRTFDLAISDVQMSLAKALTLDADAVLTTPFAIQS